MKNVRVEMTEKEFEEFKKKKGKLTSRDALFRGVGMSPAPRQRGRKSDATLALERKYTQFQADAREKVHDKLVASTLDAETSIRMYGDKSPFKSVRCKNCGKNYYTQFKTTSKCPACSVLNRTPRKPQPVKLQAGQPSTPEEKEVPGYESQRTGNLSREINLRESGTRTGGVA